MDYEEYARKFCEMHFMQAKHKLEEDKKISSKGEEGVLLCIFHMNRKALAGEISRAMELSPGRVTNILNVLEKRGYIAKEHDSQDRRKVYVILTEEGRKHVAEQYQKAVHYTSRVFEQLGEEDTEAYFRISGRIHQIAEQMRREAESSVSGEEMEQKGD